MNKNIILVFFAIILIGAGIFAYLKHTDQNAKIDKLHLQMVKIDSTNTILIKRDSLRLKQIDSLKASYKQTKTNIKRHETNFDKYRADIFWPEL